MEKKIENDLYDEVMDEIKKEKERKIKQVMKEKILQIQELEKKLKKETDKLEKMKNTDIEDWFFPDSGNTMVSARSIIPEFVTSDNLMSIRSSS